MNTIKTTITTFLLLGITIVSTAQNPTTQGVKIGNDVSPPDPSAMLEVAAADKGILIPRVDIIDLSTSDPVDSPLESLLVYNTNTGTGKGYYYWDGNNPGKWVKLNEGAGSGSSLWSEATNANNTSLTNSNGKVLIGTNTASVSTTLRPFSSKVQIHGGYPDLSFNGPSGATRFAQIGGGLRQYNYGGGHTIFMDPTDIASSEAMFQIFSKQSSLNGAYLFRIRENGDGEMSGTLAQYSDSTLKKNIQTMSSSLSKVMSLRGVTYNWKNINKGVDLKMGVIAQEVESVFPELVKTNESGLKMVNYGGLAAPLIEATKEQQLLIEQLQSTILLLEQRIATLENN